MHKPALSEVPLFFLLLELMHGGNARTIPELRPLEPIDVDSIVVELERITGKSFGRKFEKWFDWFTKRGGAQDPKDAMALTSMKEMNDKEKEIISRIMSKRKLWK